MKWKVIGEKKIFWLRYRPLKSLGVVTILGVNSRHENFGLFQNDIALDPEQIET